MIPVHVALGKELPELAWWHGQQDDPQHLAARFRAPVFDGLWPKPEGGLFAAVLRDFGRGLPDSEWAVYNDKVDAKDHPFVSAVTPDPDARFVVVDSQADAVAAHQAFPGAQGHGTLARLLGDDLEDFKAKVPNPSPLMAGLLGYGERQPPVIDWQQLERHGYAGVYLTTRGLIECQHGTATVPSFALWDVEQVWFRAPFLRVTGTSRWESV